MPCLLNVIVEEFINVEIGFLYNLVEEAIIYRLAGYLGELNKANLDILMQYWERSFEESHIYKLAVVLLVNLNGLIHGLDIGKISTVLLEGVPHICS